MIPQVVNLTRWEWFKVRRRWMPWILLVLVVAFTQAPLWGTFFDYRGKVAGRIKLDVETVGGSTLHFSTTCDDVRAGRTPELPSDANTYMIAELQGRCRIESIAETRAMFHLPGYLTMTFGLTSVLGLLMLAILTASTIGTDYSWGTLRTVLARGTGRTKYLAAKLMLILLLAAGMLCVLALVTILSSTLASALAPEAPPGVISWAETHSPGWPDMFVLMGRTFVALLAYAALAVFATVVTSSLTAGIAISLGYYFAEGIAAGILINLVKRVDVVADYLIMRNITAWMLGSKEEVMNSWSWILGGPFQFGVYPSQLHAILVLSAYLVASLGLSFWLLHRRDIPGASGG